MNIYSRKVSFGVMVARRSKESKGVLGQNSLDEDSDVSR